MSWRSSTPRLSASKCCSRLHAATASTTRIGAQRTKRLVTGSKPARISSRQAARARTKLTTWFLVRADISVPIATQAPAIRKEPM